MKQPTLHLMVGLPGSGKTTEAKRLEAQQPAVRLTPDEWHLRLFGDDNGHPEHDLHHGEIEKLLWELAEKLLAQGVSVVLDYGFWAREERAFFYEQAKRLNARFEVHYMDTPAEELMRRVAERNRTAGADVFTIEPSFMEQWIAFFQPVMAEELADYQELRP